MIIITILATLVWIGFTEYLEYKNKPLVIPYILGLGVAYMWCTFVIQA
jgi:hypothetical protein